MSILGEAYNFFTSAGSAAYSGVKCVGDLAYGAYKASSFVYDLGTKAYNGEKGFKDVCEDLDSGIRSGAESATVFEKDLCEFVNNSLETCYHGGKCVAEIADGLFTLANDLYEASPYSKDYYHDPLYWGDCFSEDFEKSVTSSEEGGVGDTVLLHHIF